MSRQLKQDEIWGFRIANFMCEAAYRFGHGDIEIEVRAGNNYYSFLCPGTLMIDEIKVYIAKKIRAELSHTMEIVADYIGYWSDSNAPTT